MAILARGRLNLKGIYILTYVSAIIMSKISLYSGQRKLRRKQKRTKLRFYETFVDALQSNNLQSLHRK